VSFGSALIIAISYIADHSILWQSFNGSLGWLYVIHPHCLGYRRDTSFGSIGNQKAVR
jgi:hypothetical protein